MPAAAAMSPGHFEPPELGRMMPPDRTALLVVDVQHDFAHPDGAMGRLGLDMSAACTAIDRIEALISAARSAGATVVFARVVSRPETDTRALRLFMQNTGRDADRALAICRHGTQGPEYHRVAPLPGEMEIEKTLFSCFAGTTLDEQLRTRGIDTLVLCGLTTDCCVDCTARDAFHRDYSVFIAADACAAYSIVTHQAALHGLAKNCAIMVGTDGLLAAWADAA